MPSRDMKAEVKITTKDLTGPGIKSATAKLQGFGKSLSSIGKKMSMFVTAPLAILGGIALKTAADFEKQQVAFETMLGSAEKAKVLLKDIIDFSAKTPFKLPGLQDAAARLLGFGIEGEKVVNTLNMLGNAAQGDQTRLDRLTLAFGKLRAKGKATLEELNMFLEAGVPILDELSSMYNVTTQEMFEMISKGKIGFEDVNKALTNLTTGTGMYAGMLEKQSQTLSGLFSTLLDNLKLLGMEMMQTMMPQIKVFVGKIMALVKHFREMTPEQKKMIVMFAGIVAAIGPVLMAIGMLVTAIGMVMSPITLVIVGIAALATAGILLYKNWDKVCAFLKAMWEDLKKVGIIIFQSLKLAVLTYAQTVLKAVTIMGRALGKVFGFEVKKLEDALESLNGKVKDTYEIIIDTATGTWESGKYFAGFGEKIKELAGKLKDGVITLKEFMASLGDIPSVMEKADNTMAAWNGTADDSLMKWGKLRDGTEEASGELSDLAKEMQGQITVWDATIDKWDTYVRLMKDSAHPIMEVKEELSDLAKALKTAEEALQTAEDFFSEHWQNMWEIMGDQTLSGADKVKKVFQNLLADLLRMYGDYLKKMGLAMMLLDPVAGIGFLGASALAYMGAGAIASLKKGGDFVTNGPQLLLVGDNPSGREHVRVDPLDSRGSMGPTIIVHVYGSIQTEKDLAQTIAREISRQRYSVV